MIIAPQLLEGGNLEACFPSFMIFSIFRTSLDTHFVYYKIWRCSSFTRSLENIISISLCFHAYETFPLVSQRNMSLTQPSYDTYSFAPKIRIKRNRKNPEKRRSSLQWISRYENVDQHSFLVSPAFHHNPAKRKIPTIAIAPFCFR